MGCVPPCLGREGVVADGGRRAWHLQVGRERGASAGARYCTFCLCAFSPLRACLSPHHVAPPLPTLPLFAARALPRVTGVLLTHPLPYRLSPLSLLWRAAPVSMCVCALCWVGPTFPLAPSPPRAVDRRAASRTGAAATRRRWRFGRRSRRPRRPLRTGWRACACRRSARRTMCGCRRRPWRGGPRARRCRRYGRDGPGRDGQWGCARRVRGS